MAADQEEFHRERERDRIESTGTEEEDDGDLAWGELGDGARDEKEPEQREDRKSKGSHWREDGQVWVVPEKRVEVEQASLEVRLHQTEQGQGGQQGENRQQWRQGRQQGQEQQGGKVATGATSAAAESGG